MKFKFSCYGCEKRSPGCHGSCETYKQERLEYEAQKAEIEKAKAISDGIYRQRSNGVARAERKKPARRNIRRKVW